MKTRLIVVSLAMFGLFLAAVHVPDATSSAQDSKCKPEASMREDYVIATNLPESDEYYQAVRKLQEHRNAKTVARFAGRNLEPLFAELKRLQPRFVTFVLRPGDIDLNLNYEILERASALDDDPFVDFGHGFITGKSAKAALALVENIIRAETNPAGHPHSGVDFGPVTVEEDRAFDSTRPHHGSFRMTTFQHSTKGFPESAKDLLNGVGLARYWGHGMPEGVCDGLTAAQAKNLDTWPAVIFGGACYTGVCGTTFDKSLGKPTCAARVIAPEESFCLNLLASGCTGFFAALDPDHGITAGQEMQHLMETGCELGAAMAYSYGLITLAGGEMKGKFHRLEDGKPQPSKIGVGTNKYFEIMRHGAACRALFGDPAFKPYRQALVEPMFTASVDWRSRQGRITMRDGDWYGAIDIFHCDEKGHMANKLMATVEIPAGVTVSNVRATSLQSNGRDLGSPVYSAWQIETRGEKRLLHVQFDVAGDALPIGNAGAATFADFVVETGDSTAAPTPAASYVVAVEDGAGDGWQDVGKKLADHRKAKLVRFKLDDLKALVPQLRDAKARYLALVMRPQSLDANVTRELVPLLTGIDEDPFVDVAFGVITGATASDALKFVNNIIRAEKEGVPGRGVGLHAAGVDKCMELGEADSIYGSPGRAFPYREHYVYGKDPNWKNWWQERRDHLKGNGLIDLGSCGDSQGIWLFPAERNMQREKHWKYDPNKVGDDPKGEMPRLTPEIIFGGKDGPDVFPAVVVNGSCHSAVTCRTVVEADIVSTFGDTEGKVIFHEIAPEQSFPLAAIAHGATAYIGPLAANHASRASIENSYMLTMGAPLGDVMLRCYNELVMGSADRSIFVPRLVANKPSPHDEGWCMWVDCLHRVLIGDPAFNPFSKPAQDVEKVSVEASAKGVRVTLEVSNPTQDVRIWDPWCKEGGNNARLLAVVKLPSSATRIVAKKLVEAKVKREGNWQDVSLGLQAELEFCADGTTVLHLKASGKRGDLEQEWTKNEKGEYELAHGKPEAIRAVFEVELDKSQGTGTTPPKTGESSFAPAKLWDMPLKGAAFGSAATGDLDGDGKPEIVFGTYFGESRTYCVDGATGKVKWFFEVKRGPIDGSVVIADVTGDAKPEVLFAGSASGEIVCLDGQGKQIWAVDDEIDGETFDGAIAVGDLDGNGTREILIASALRLSGEGVLYSRAGKDGKIIWQQKLQGWIQNSVTLVDIDGDKLDDCVVATWRGDNTVQAFSGKDGKPLWKYQAGGWMYHCPSVGDLDGDGKDELAIGGYDQCLHILNLKGEAVRVIDVGLHILAPTTMHDIDGDGKLEVIVTTLAGQDGKSRAIAYDGNGKQVWNVAVGAGAIWRGTVVAEVDGAPGLELLIQPEEECALVALEPKSGKELWRISLADYNTKDRLFRTSSATVVDDFDGDGKNDVFFSAGGDLENRFGLAVCFKGNGKGQKWTTFHGNLRHHNRAPK